MEVLADHLLFDGGGPFIGEKLTVQGILYARKGDLPCLFLDERQAAAYADWLDHQRDHPTQEAWQPAFHRLWLDDAFLQSRIDAEMRWVILGRYPPFLAYPATVVGRVSAPRLADGRAWLTELELVIIAPFGEDGPHDSDLPVAYFPQENRIVAGPLHRDITNPSDRSDDPAMGAQYLLDNASAFFGKSVTVMGALYATPQSISRLFPTYEAAQAFHEEKERRDKEMDAPAGTSGRHSSGLVIDCHSIWDHLVATIKKQTSHYDVTYLVHPATIVGVISPPLDASETARITAIDALVVGELRADEWDVMTLPMTYFPSQKRVIGCASMASVKMLPQS